jgi:hypothetical protein
MCHFEVERAASLYSALEALVRSDLAIGFYRNIQPPAHYAVHSRRVAELTLVRARYTRAKYQSESPVAGMETALADDVLNFFNGDWRKHFLQHFCIGPTLTHPFGSVFSRVHYLENPGTAGLVCHSVQIFSSRRPFGVGGYDTKRWPVVTSRPRCLTPHRTALSSLACGRCSPEILGKGCMPNQTVSHPDTVAGW